MCIYSLHRGGERIARRQSESSLEVLTPSLSSFGLAVAYTLLKPTGYIAAIQSTKVLGKHNLPELCSELRSEYSSPRSRRCLVRLQLDWPRIPKGGRSAGPGAEGQLGPKARTVVRSAVPLAAGRWQQSPGVAGRSPSGCKGPFPFPGGPLLRFSPRAFCGTDPEIASVRP